MRGWRIGIAVRRPLAAQTIFLTWIVLMLLWTIQVQLIPRLRGKGTTHRDTDPPAAH